MLISKAYMFRGGDTNEILPEFLQSCFKNLSSVLKTEYDQDYLEFASGVKDLDDKWKKQAKLDIRIKQAKEMISEQMTWEKAKSFLEKVARNSKSSPDAQKRKEEYREFMKKEFGKTFNSWSQREMDEVIIFSLFEHTFEKSISFLKVRTMESLMKLSRELFKDME